MDNRGKLAIKDTQDSEKQNKNATQCFGHQYSQRNTNTVNKIRCLLQKTVGNDEPNIAFMRKSLLTSQYEKTYNRTTQKKTQKMSSMDPTKNPGVKISVYTFFYTSIVYIYFIFIEQRYLRRFMRLEPLISHTGI